MKATKLTCTTCATEICFQCRGSWHGESVTCEQSMQKELEGWVNENKDNVSFCPCCRSRIEKNQGCNHMTCGFCKYEFCWSCGQSATSGENHWNGNGCGVLMMDSSIRPGDHLRIAPKVQKVGEGICIAILGLLASPFVLLFFMPIAVAVLCYDSGHKAHNGAFVKLLKTICGFILGAILNICFIPLALCGTMCWILQAITRTLSNLCGGRNQTAL